ncbi:MAG: hypothetical protein AAFV33_00695 [Chloroflexota bacterium]
MLAVVLYMPVFVGIFFTSPDYLIYVQGIREWEQTGILNVSQFVYPLLVIGVQRVLPFLSLEASAAWVTVIGYAVYLFVLFRLIMAAIAPEKVAPRIQLTVGVLTLLLIMAYPIVLPSFLRGNLAFGYTGITYHNPPINLLKPLMLPLFLLAVYVLRNREISRWQLLWLGAGGVVSLVMKPNYMLALLPTVGLLGLVRLVRGESVPIRHLVFGLAVPVMLLMALQYIIVFVMSLGVLDDLESSIVFAPFAALQANDITNANADEMLFIKLLCSVAFPLLVYGLYWPQSRRDYRFNAAWLFYVISLGYFYLLAETGPRLEHGNFLWNGEIGFIVLFSVAFLFFVARNRDVFLPAEHDEKLELPWQAKILLPVLMLHVLSGVVWYYLHVTGEYRFWF